MDREIEVLFGQSPAETEISSGMTVDVNDGYEIDFEIDSGGQNHEMSPIIISSGSGRHVDQPTKG